MLSISFLRKETNGINDNQEHTFLDTDYVHGCKLSVLWLWWMGFAAFSWVCNIQSVMKLWGAPFWGNKSGIYPSLAGHSRCRSICAHCVLMLLAEVSDKLEHIVVFSVSVQWFITQVFVCDHFLFYKWHTTDSWRQLSAVLDSSS